MNSYLIKTFNDSELGGIEFLKISRHIVSHQFRLTPISKRMLNYINLSQCLIFTCNRENKIISTIDPDKVGQVRNE